MATSRPSRFPRVPYGAIRWLVDKLHVGDTDTEVEAEITARMLRAKLHDTRKVPVTAGQARPAEIREAVRYALAVHADNREMYRRVMSGRLS